MRPQPNVRDALKRHIAMYDSSNFTNVMRLMDAGLSTEQIASNLGWSVSQARGYQSGIDNILEGNTTLSPVFAGKIASKVRRLMRNDMAPEVGQYLGDYLAVVEDVASSHETKHRTGVRPY